MVKLITSPIESQENHDAEQTLSNLVMQMVNIESYKDLPVWDDNANYAKYFHCTICYDRFSGTYFSKNLFETWKRRYSMVLVLSCGA